jgi:hypothetical protein
LAFTGFEPRDQTNKTAHPTGEGLYIGEIQKLTAPRNAAVNMAVDIVHGVNRGLYPFKHIMQFPYSKLHYFKCYYLLFLPLKSLAIKG